MHRNNEKFQKELQKKRDDALNLFDVVQENHKNAQNIPSPEHLKAIDEVIAKKTAKRLPKLKKLLIFKMKLLKTAAKK